ncbi:MAG: MerC domain-containing protein [Bacteroidetes bacterium]|nr:MerC domain-containing protein [Bacteroidota bacterium]
MKTIKHNLSLKLDFIGFIASSVCAVHCFLMPFIIITLTYYGMSFFNNPLFEITFISISLIIGIFTFRHGYLNHHKSLVPGIIFITGLIIIIVSHFLYHEHHEVNHDLDNLFLFIITPLGAVLIAVSHVINRKLTREKHKAACKC